MDTKDKILAVIGFVLSLALNVTIVGGIAYIIYHFITKWW
jgi:hypothetical protein